MIDLDEHGTYATIAEASTHYGVAPVTIYAWTYRRNIRTAYSQRQLHVNLDDIDAYRWIRGRCTVESRAGGLSMPTGKMRGCVMADDQQGFHYDGTRDELKAEIVAAVLEALKIQAEAIADKLSSSN